MSKEGGNFGPTLVSHGIISLACRPECVAFDSRCKRLIGISIELINNSVVFIISVICIIIVVPVVSATVVAATATVTTAVASVTLQSTCFFQMKLLIFIVSWLDHILTDLGNVVFEVLRWLSLVATLLIQVSEKVLAAH